MIVINVFIGGPLEKTKYCFFGKEFSIFWKNRGSDLSIFSMEQNVVMHAWMLESWLSGKHIMDPCS